MPQTSTKESGNADLLADLGGRVAEAPTGGEPCTSDVALTEARSFLSGVHGSVGHTIGNGEVVSPVLQKDNPQSVRETMKFIETLNLHCHGR